jgi:hypothetical protein
MTPLPIEGGCSCGAVRYRLDGEPLASATCQCRSCRRAAAAPIVPWLHVDAGRFTITAGTPVAFASSPDVTRTFCGRCGTPLTYAKQTYGGKIDVTTCSLDDPEAFPPRVHLWTSHKLDWVALADGIPSLAEGGADD